MVQPTWTYIDWDAKRDVCIYSVPFYGQALTLHVRATLEPGHTASARVVRLSHPMLGDITVSDWDNIPAPLCAVIAAIEAEAAEAAIEDAESAADHEATDNYHRNLR